MGFLSVLTMAQRLAAERIAPGATVVDATAGGGVDTLFLARTVGPGGRVYAFDVQEAALARTKKRLLEAAEADGGAALALGEVTLLHAGHEEMAAHVPAEAHGRVGAVMFNLGYLPRGADASAVAGPIITKPDTTLTALDAAIRLLAPGGIATIAVYPGHEGGQDEATAVGAWIDVLPDEAVQALLYRFPKRAGSPYLYALEKK
ncbi:tRNA (mnm(5)s(2)U34)-methyltransferase [Cohnella rhizosphaerae]|uniref:SAM-dependent methyltransferase n=1 Tax=Cohnella rhizosphaerae TaxID=1457232 RepID=A0A9X4KNJ5_9BACL|nr:class I SAM-dependent methyltransferase [Cohnella rhizosphaerae]MDG0808311.1 SAM-dependent methyltransferase [Cohnella rhizosphaerae]